MLNTLANTTAESLVLISIFKPIIVMIVLLGWARIVSKLDKDAAFFFLERYRWNAIQLTCAVMAFAVWLLLSYFWIGLLLALLILAAGVMGYAFYRNDKVPAPARWTFSWESLTRPLDEYQYAQAQREAYVTLMTPELAKIDVPVSPDPNAEAHQVLTNAILFALPRGADRIDIAAEAKQGMMTVHVDGLRYPQPKLDPALAVRLIDYLKEYSGLEVSDRRRMQRGRLPIDCGDLGQHTMSLTTSGSIREIKTTIRIDTQQRGSIGVAKLGLLPNQMQQFKPVLESNTGIVLVAVPRGQGKTTTLYSLLREHDPYTQSVVTLEGEIWFDVEGVTQDTIATGETIESINRRLATTLRQDPQVLMLTKLNDPTTAKLLARSASEVRMYVGMRHEDTFTALRAWIKAVGDPHLAANALAGIVSQRLGRTLCRTCRLPYTPDPDALRKLNLPPEKVGQLYKESGQVYADQKKTRTQPCPDCLGMGYHGRVAVFEVMVLDDQARQHILSDKLSQLRAHLRKQKMLWLQEAALARVVEGVSSIGEITRALGGK